MPLRCDDIDVLTEPTGVLLHGLLRVLIQLDIEEVVDGAFEHLQEEGSRRKFGAFAEEFGSDQAVYENGRIFQGPYDVDCDTLQVVDVYVAFGLAEETFGILPELIDFGGKCEFKGLVNQVDFGYWTLLPGQRTQVLESHLVRHFRRIVLKQVR